MSQPRYLSLERAIIYKESMTRSEGQPQIIRRAKAFADLAGQIGIAVHPDELIIGGRTAVPRSGVASPEMGADWLLGELDTISSRFPDSFIVTEEQKRIYREELYPFYHGRDMKSYIMEGIGEDACQIQSARVFRLNQTDKGQGHIVPDYSALLNIGVGQMLRDLDSKIKTHPDNPFYQASYISFRGFQILIGRYLSLANEQLDKTEDTARRQELTEICSCLEVIREEPPQTFHQALQLFWLTCVALQLESNASSISIGRFDQFMLPFFSKDLILDRLNYEKAHLLLSCLWIKMNEVIFLRSEESTGYFGGFPTGYNLVLGGVLPNGWDATSELSYICLDVTADIRLPQPNVSVRVHQSTPTSFLKRTADIILLGFGIPQLFNDDSIILSLANRGVKLADARDYGVVGCVQISIPGKMYGMPDVALFNLLKCFELVLHRGYDPISGQSFPVVIKGDIENCFEDFEASLHATIALYVEWVCKAANQVDTAQREFAPVPLLSALMDGCLEKGQDITEGGTIYNFTGVQQIGIANLADSMYVLRTFVFEARQITIGQLRDILLANYGENEDLRQAFIRNYAKYGNDVREVDELAAKYLAQFCECVSQHQNPRGGYFSPGSYTVSAHIPMGKMVGATPDGRLSRTMLADGGLSPEAGYDQKGPTSVLRTVSRLDSVLLSNGSLLNLRFHPSSFLKKDSFDKFFELVKTFISLKLMHVQFSVVSGEDLLDAREHPEKHEGLMVRVAGYSALFNDLSPEIQNDIIKRYEHHLE